MSGTVVITGATGFAGSFLVEHYAARGWQVYGTYRDPARDRSWAPPGVHLYPVDLLDAREVSDLIEAAHPDIIHHLAAQSSVALSWGDPIGTLRENATAQYNVLEGVATFCRQARVLVVGSCDEYGNVDIHENPVDETQELRPSNPYGLSKVAQDLMARQYVETSHLRIVRVRPFLQIGPRRQARFVAGSFARQVAEIERGLREPEIFVGNIDLRRDFTDVRDVVRAYALAVEGGEPGEVYNIASGEAHSLREMLAIMLDRSGVRAVIQEDVRLRRTSEAPLLIGDAGRLRRATGWQPEISFERSVVDTLEYWRARVGDGFIPQGERA